MTIFMWISFSTDVQKYEDMGYDFSIAVIVLD